VAAALLAAALIAFGHLMGWQGVDTAGQVYRVDSFRHSGFTMWDFSWYGGHWTPDYSVLYPPLAATVGMLTVTIVSAAVAALSFDRLVRPRLGPGGPAASFLFAAGTLVAASIGQLTFLAGAASGLAAVWAGSRSRWAAALPLALACTLTSPLSGAFLALAAAAWGVDHAWAGDRSVAGPDQVTKRARWPRLARPHDWRSQQPANLHGRARFVGDLSQAGDDHRADARRPAKDRPSALWAIGMAAVAAVPIVAAGVLFPGDGPMPYPVFDWLWEMAVAGGLAVLAIGRHRVIVIGALFYMAAATAAVVIPSPLGGNVGRLEDLVALPLAAGLAWTRAPLLLPFAAVPLALSQWSPAWGAFTEAAEQPSTHSAFYATLDRVLQDDAAGRPAGRVEVVPTAWHWEANFVAPVMPLARGWERQLDEADNPIFYASGPITAGAYRAWLVDNGVRFVALPAAPLDMAGRAEGALVMSGRVPGLQLVWRSADWRLYAVEGSPGIVSGPARLVRASDGRVVLDALGPGQVTVRIRWSPGWHVSGGAGCLTRQNDWIALQVPRPGQVSLAVSPTAALDADRPACPPVPVVSSTRE
jgi:hypothetical protein